MEIQRIDTYADSRFSECALFQHGCFLVEGKPYEIEIISDFEAVVRGEEKEVYLKIIEEFIFNAPHITKFYNSRGNIIKEYSTVFIKTILLEEIQPSQFYVDEEKVFAIQKFVHIANDIIIPVMSYKGRYISLDGHTRLYYAVLNEWKAVRAVVESSDVYIFDFVKEAQKREIYTPQDIKMVSHSEYEKKWYQFCDEYFKIH